MKKKLRQIGWICLACIVFAGTFFYVSHALMRKTKYGDWNYLVKVGNFDLIEENSLDVLFLGSSHAYCSLDAVLLSEEYDLESYVLATQQQSVKLNYYYMIEALKTQSPHTIVIELFMIGRSGEYQDDDILHDAIDVLPWSINKHNLIQDAVPEEKRLEYYFPIIKYHSRWKELTLDDFSFDYLNWIDEERGFVRLKQTYSTDLDLSMSKSESFVIDEQDLEYLNKIESLAQENGIELIYVYAPYPMDQSGVNIAYALEEYSDSKGIVYLNGYELLSKLNYDGETDFCDEYGHLNESGARKLTEYLVSFLK